jgi:hypothetical protein
MEVVMTTAVQTVSTQFEEINAGNNHRLSLLGAEMADHTSQLSALQGETIQNNIEQRVRALEQTQQGGGGNMNKRIAGLEKILMGQVVPNLNAALDQAQKNKGRIGQMVQRLDNLDAQYDQLIVRTQQLANTEGVNVLLDKMKEVEAVFEDHRQNIETIKEMTRQVKDNHAMEKQKAARGIYLAGLPALRAALHLPTSTDPMEVVKRLLQKIDRPMTHELITLSDRQNVNSNRLFCRAAIIYFYSPQNKKDMEAAIKGILAKMKAYGVSVRDVFPENKLAEVRSMMEMGKKMKADGVVSRFRISNTITGPVLTALYTNETTFRRVDMPTVEDMETETAARGQHQQQQHQRGTGGATESTRGRTTQRQHPAGRAAAERERKSAMAAAAAAAISAVPAVQQSVNKVSSISGLHKALPPPHSTLPVTGHGRDAVIDSGIMAVPSVGLPKPALLQMKDNRSYAQMVAEAAGLSEEEEEDFQL